MPSISAAASEGAIRSRWRSMKSSESVGLSFIDH
jgi:hypothetical protein